MALLPSRSRPPSRTRQQERNRQALAPLKSQTLERSAYASAQGVGLVTTRKLAEQLERERFGQNQLDFFASSKVRAYLQKSLS